MIDWLCVLFNNWQIDWLIDWLIPFLIETLHRSWCPDRTLHQARKYIADTMGERYAEGVILNLEATWEESNPRTPLICFLSMGSDPTGAIENLAKRKGIGTYGENVTLGRFACFFRFWFKYFDFGTKKLPGSSRNEPLPITVDLWVCGLCFCYLDLFAP